METITPLNLLPENLAQLLSTGSVAELEAAETTLRAESQKRLAALDSIEHEAHALRAIERAFIVAVAYAKQGEMRAAIFTYQDRHPFVAEGGHGNNPEHLLGVGRLVYDECQRVGLQPSLTWCGEDCGWFSGFTINIHWERRADGLFPPFSVSSFIGQLACMMAN